MQNRFKKRNGEPLAVPRQQQWQESLSLIGLVDMLLLGGAQALSSLLWVALCLSAGSKEDGYGANQALSWWQLRRIPGI